MSDHPVSNKGILSQTWDDISERFRRFKREHYADCARFTELTGLKWQPANYCTGGEAGSDVAYQTSVATTHNTAKKLIEIMNTHLVLDRHEQGFPWENIFLNNNLDGSMKLVIYPHTYRQLVRRPEFDAAALKQGCLAFVENLQSDQAAKENLRLDKYCHN